MFEFLKGYIGESPASVVVALFAAALIIQIPAVGALVFVWAERKVSGRIQDRLGPTRVGGKFGWLQGLADGIKLLSKEDLMPASADGFLFRIAPYVGFCASYCAFLAM
ncbi:MAG TPA: NADH-quinone oxidoreductase subunit H, partial [Pirellulales bacterium]|nr:NADH-quinone oxidoreductase subunit H [Pirellulales bacterium]